MTRNPKRASKIPQNIQLALAEKGESSSLIEKDLKLNFTPTGLTFREDISEEEYQYIGQYLAETDSRAQSALLWMWADWWAFSNISQSAKIKFVESTHWVGPTATTLSIYSRVAERYPNPETDRFPELTFAHHSSAAGFDTIKERRKALKFAIKNNLSARALRERVNLLLGKKIDQQKLIEAMREPVSVEVTDEDIDFEPGLLKDDADARLQVARAMEAWFAFCEVLEENPKAIDGLGENRRMRHDIQNSFAGVAFIMLGLNKR